MLIAFDVEAVREEMQRERALSGAFRPDHDEALAFEHKTSAMHHRRSRSLLQDGGEDGLVDAIGRFNERGLDPLSVRELKPEAVIGLLDRDIDRSEGRAFNLRSCLDEGEELGELGRSCPDAVFAADAADDDRVQGLTRSS
jgi:hypothetical protein